ncbi:MAG: hypothetical protein AVDCRST_MAG93-3894, partial [uncultured Chloroflexia bacterium]
DRKQLHTDAEHSRAEGSRPHSQPPRAFAARRRCRQSV